ncbi:MAG: radical SAM protein [Lachnospiraceae bacterium]|nr:radical SAM protein [Lachnospiraceae bacterium]
MRSARQIKTQLEHMGLVETCDFAFYKQFIGQYFWETRREIVLPYVEVMLTNACTLKCRYCGLYTNHMDQRFHRDVNEIKGDVCRLFEITDRLITLHLLGGEPFLYPDLVEVLDYIGRRFGARIGTLVVVTNGTVKIQETVLQALKRYNVEVSISNYTKTIPYEKTLRDLCEILERWHIPYDAARLEKWTCLGSPWEARNRDAEALQSIYYDCNTRCRSLYQGKLFYCGGEASLAIAGMYEPVEGDYLSLDALGELRREEAAEKLSAFGCGRNETGYISFCEYCDGYGGLNTNYILPAEQERSDGRQI